MNNAIQALDIALQLAKTRGIVATSVDTLLNDADKIQDWMDDKTPSAGTEAEQPPLQVF